MRNGTPQPVSVSTVRSSPSSVASTSGSTTTSQPHDRAAATLLPLTLSTSSAPALTAASTSAGLKLSMETRSPFVAQRLHGVADAGPGVAGVAAHVDQVGAVGPQRPRLGQQFLARQTAGRG